jgi:hypothetical protein
MHAVNSLLRVVESSSLHSFNRRFGIASGPASRYIYCLSTLTIVY